MHCFEEIYWPHENLFNSERYVDFNEKSICFKGDSAGLLASVGNPLCDIDVHLEK